VFGAIDVAANVSLMKEGRAAPRGLRGQPSAERSCTGDGGSADDAWI